MERERDSTAMVDIEPFIPLEAALMGTLMTIATLLVPLSSPYATRIMLFGFGGFILFLIAKFSLIPKGQMATWGPSPMKVAFKISYIFGYLLMIYAAIEMVFNN